MTANFDHALVTKGVVQMIIVRERVRSGWRREEDDEEGEREEERESDDTRRGGHCPFLFVGIGEY